ncbi:hypothetical protein [Streptomyces sp. NPDC053542]|uniref:hypothetical protein n=1 Tax=Streptomyces sp. NPDC053542 TaxID=3365710 RepID=UPI0037D3A863
MAELGTAAYVQWAENLIEVLNGAPADVDCRELTAERAAALQAARQLVTEVSDPLTVGVVGEYSAGKTLLIEALLGMPGLLAVSDVATTGNVTAIHIAQAPDDASRPTTVGRAVTYCTPAETAELMSHLHQELVRVVGPEKLSDQAVSELAAARPSREGWAALTTWCSEHAGSVLGPVAGSLMKEIQSLDAAYQSGAQLLGRRYRVSDEQAKRAMTLPDVQLAQAGRAGEARADVGEGDWVPDKVLADTSQLIRRVELTVRVPPRIWDLGEEGGLTLVDSAGLNSQESRQRDRFLSIRELRDIHTILVLINAQHGPVGSEQDFFDMLREPTADGRPQRPEEILRECLLVASGRFDEMPVAPAALHAALDSSAALTERKLMGLADMAVLNKLVKAAYRLPLGTQEKQLVLASAVVGLDVMARAGILRLDQDFRARLRFDQALNRAAPVVTLWKQVAERLDEDDHGTPLGRALEEFAKDGGLDYLRGRLTRHARIHGGPLKLDAVRRRAEAVDRHRLSLITIARDCSPEMDELPVHDEIHEALGRTRRLLADLRESLVLRSESAPREAARRRIEAEAAGLVARWPQWKRLFGAVDRDKQLITARESAITSGLGSIGERAARKARQLGLTVTDQASPKTGGTALPGEPEEMLEQFRDCYRELLRVLRGQVLAEYEQRLDPYADSMDELYEQWESLAVRQQGEAKPEFNQRLAELLVIVDVDEWIEQFRQIPAVEPKAADADAAYPLRLDRALTWHPEMPDGRDPLERHIVHAVRVRRELVSALLYLVSGHLAAEERRIASTADKYIDAAEDLINAPDTLELLRSGTGGTDEAPQTAILEFAAKLEMLSPPTSGARMSHRLRRRTQRQSS